VWGGVSPHRRLRLNV
jgi:hypothetical protein